MGKLIGPQLLSPKHDVKHFDCGNSALNNWIIKTALKNQGSGASKTFVICKAKRVVGYYALASGSIERDSAPKAISRNMPQPIPVLVLGRLAIDNTCQGEKLGSWLLRDALLRTTHVSENIGVRALLVHAISTDAKEFYRRYGFIESPSDPMTLLLSIKHIFDHL